MSLGRALVVTVSDSAALGKRRDLSGPEARGILEEVGFQVESIDVLPDEADRIRDRLLRASDEEQVSIVVTTGGTGLSPRDVTPEATQQAIEREVPGMAELMRLKGIEHTPRAALSRAVVGVRRRTLIINLPGSVKGVQESLAALVPILPHAVEVISQTSLHCGE